MLGLDRGGSCTGVGYRIAKNSVRTELDILFRRELLSHAYIPTWVKMRFTNGYTHHGITFVMDKKHERYAGVIDQTTQVHHIATAEGPLGPNKEYLFDLVEHLDQLGLHDRALSQLAERVRGYTKQK
jgi:cation transport protein ChaC